MAISNNLEMSVVKKLRKMVFYENLPLLNTLKFLDEKIDGDSHLERLYLHSSFGIGPEVYKNIEAWRRSGYKNKYFSKKIMNHIENFRKTFNESYDQK